jgi:hypothetical protein
MSEYTYTLEQTKNKSVDRLKLWEEIEIAILTPSLENISLLEDGFVCIFSSSLDQTTEDLLQEIVSAHEAENKNSIGLVESKTISTPPFAEPDFRTKRDGTASWITVSPSSNQVIDFLLTEERYVTGGEIIFKNAKQGDYISAEVYDTDSVIPEPYRAPLCEAWPSVSKYVVKKWLVPTEVDKYGSFTIDTYPLNAKISAGLYLRVAYHSSAESGNREVAINYHLTKKIAE